MQHEFVSCSSLTRAARDNQFKGALLVYEAVLKVAPEDIEMLAGLALLLIYSCRYPTKLTWPRALELLAQAQTLSHAASGAGLSESLTAVEENCVYWKLFLEPKNANAIGIYALFLQCIHRELEKAELLYRRAIDADPTNEFVLENYRRLERERTPDGIYSSAGPSKIARWRAEVRGGRTASYEVLVLEHLRGCARCAQEVARVGLQWAVMDDAAARAPRAR
ncbi:hypothetical protein PybrP1_008434, partial [[Pythium] brassicae (nom. inval.)]